MELLNRWSEALRIAKSHREQTARYIAGESAAPWTVATKAEAAVESTAKAA